MTFPRNAKLLTYSNATIAGGVEVVSDIIRKFNPGIEVISRENVSVSFSEKILFPAMPEVQVAHALGGKILKERSKTDFIFSNGMQGAFTRSEKWQIPCLSVMHGTFAGLAEHAFQKMSPAYWRMRYPYAHFEAQSARNAHVVMANSRGTQQELQEYYGVRSHINHLPIDTRIFCPGDKSKSRKRMQWDPKKKIIVFAGNPTYSKGFDIVQSLAAQNPAIEFHCFLRPADAEKNTSNLFQHPSIPHEQFVHALRAADALVFPSRYEGFGFVPLEALASGCPVVSQEVGILREFHAQGNIRVRDSLDAFQVALQEALEMDVEKETLDAIRQKFSLAAYGQRLKALMQDAQAAAK